METAAFAGAAFALAFGSAAFLGAAAFGVGEAVAGAAAVEVPASFGSSVLSSLRVLMPKLGTFSLATRLSLITRCAGAVLGAAPSPPSAGRLGAAGFATAEAAFGAGALLASEADLVCWNGQLGPFRQPEGCDSQ